MDALGDVWFFDRVAPLYDRLLPGTDAAAIEAGLARADREVVRAVAVAGGTGRELRGLDLRNPIVVDPSRPMLRQARRKGYPVVRGAAEHLPLADGSVDAVLVVDALHHVRGIDAALREAGRVLADGGVLVVREFDPSTLRGRAVRAAQHLVGFGSTFLTPGELSARIEAAGLEPAVTDRGWGYTAVGHKR